MTDTMGPPLPADLELRLDYGQSEALDALTRLSNRALFGREEKGDENLGEPTAFRSVVIVVGVTAMTAVGVRPVAIGVSNSDGSEYARETWPKVVRRLRQIANDIERSIAAGDARITSNQEEES